MAEWKSKKIADLVPEDEFSNLLDAVDNVINDFQDATDALIAAIGTSKGFMLESLDPVKVILDLLVQEINNFIKDFLAHGGYLLLVPPKLYGERATDREMLGDIMP
ncbi:MAG: hypothetical protein ABIH23_31475, partial [bacterium]